MARKYQRFDRTLFAWLRGNREGITTAMAITALKVTDQAKQRHISRRFTQLEDRGVLQCTLKGTTRICNVVNEVPCAFGRDRLRSRINAEIQTTRSDPMTPPGASLPAHNSEAFLAAGGTIERLPSHWDKPLTGSKPYGPSFFDDID